MSNETTAWNSLPEHLKGDTIIQIFKELSVVKTHSRMLVLVTHGFVELLVGALIEAKAKNAKKILQDSRSYPHSTKLLLLHELGLIDDDLYKVFDWFRKLRNRAAHDAIFSVTKSDLQRLKNEEHRDPDKFYSLCVMLIGGFWNQYVEVFGPVFAPGAVGENDTEQDADDQLPARTESEAE